MRCFGVFAIVFFLFISPLAPCGEQPTDREKVMTYITELINQGGINAQNATGFTPLACAVDGGLEDVCGLLIEQGADVNRMTYYHWSPLMYAVSKGHTGIVQRLLENGAEPNHYNNGGQTALLMAVEMRQKPIVTLLLEHGADGTAMDGRGKTVLDYAAKNDDQGMLKLLVDQGVDVNLVNGDGRTCFCVNTEFFSGNHDFLKPLLVLGADPKIPPVTGEPDPVYLAAKGGEAQWAAKLKELGAVRDVWRIAPPGFVPEQYITQDTWDNPTVEFTDAFNQFLKTYTGENNAWQFTDEAGNTFLHWAAENNQPDWTQWAIGQGMDANVRSAYGRTALHRAAGIFGAQAAVRVLLEYGADVKAADFLGNTPLHYAADRCNQKVIEMLLAKGADINAVNHYGRTPLHSVSLSSGVNTSRTIQMLLAEGADPTIRDFRGETILHLVCRELDSFPETVQAVIRKGADVNQPNRMGAYPLHLTYRYANLTSILIQSGAALEVRNYEGQTPLSRAAAEQETAVVKALIEAGADVNARSYTGLVPLHYAAWYGAETIARQLLDAGADLSAVSYNGEKTLDLAKRNKQVKMVTFLEQLEAQGPAAVTDSVQAADDKPVFDKAKVAADNARQKEQERLADEARIRGEWMYHCKEGSLAMAVLQSDPNAVRLAVAKGADVNEYFVIGISYQYTAVYMAARFRDEAMVRLLAEVGADVNLGQRKPALSSPLHLAAEYGYLPMTKLLIELGADMHGTDGDGRTPFVWAALKCRKGLVDFYTARGFDIHMKDDKGRSLLFDAVQWSSTVRFLLEQGLDANAPDKYGKTPLLAAMNTAGQDSIAVPKLLVEHGADVNAMDKAGNTPLCEALAWDRLQTAQYLIEAGADVTVGQSGFRQNGPPIHLAKGNIEVLALLLNYGADMTALNSKQQNVIHSLAGASTGGTDDVAALEYFIEQGVDINGKDKDGRTPLFCSIDANRIDLLEALLEHGAEIEAVDKHGRTPLWFAGRNKKTLMVKLLLKSGAAVDIADAYGKTLKEEMSGSEYRDVYELIFPGG